MAPTSERSRSLRPLRRRDAVDEVDERRGDASQAVR
jgi:hypothetical protein